MNINTIHESIETRKLRANTLKLLTTILYEIIGYFTVKLLTH